MNSKLEVEVKEVILEIDKLLDEIHQKWKDGYKYDGDPTLFTFYDEMGERSLRFCKVELETILDDLQNNKFSYYTPALGQMISDQWIGMDAAKLGGKIMRIEDNYMKLRNNISGRYEAE